LGIVRVSSGEKFSKFGQFYIKRVSNFKKNIFIRRMKWITQISKTISNIKFPSHNKDIINVNLSILEILQSWLRWIRVYINKKLNGTVIEKKMYEISLWLRTLFQREKRIKKSVKNEKSGLKLFIFSLLIFIFFLIYFSLFYF